MSRFLYKNNMLKKYKTSNDNLLFVGFDGNEEFYQDITETKGFIGLRPKTDEELIKIAEDKQITDYFSISKKLERYIDYQLFEQDMIHQRLEFHDSRAERTNEDGELLYLGFGTGTSAFYYFKKHDIENYKDYCNHFEIVGLNKKEFLNFKKKFIDLQ